MTEGLRVALVSLEAWDDVWRRNQHFAVNLVRSGEISQLLFLEPPKLGHPSSAPRDVAPGIRAVPPALRLPKRAGGLAELGRRLRKGVLLQADVLWINDPALGVHCLRAGQPALYDVTDDWRSYPFPRRIVRRLVAAEDVLARKARTVVCSTELQNRWHARYGVNPSVVHNGVDADAWSHATPRAYEGASPHVGYVGTLQSERLDIDLLLRVADDHAVGTVHLIGPDSLDDISRTRLLGHPKVLISPALPAADVPSWTKGLDVLLSPHLVNPFTLSLDAIKSYEYMASGRPVVATPTSGFQHLDGTVGVHVVNSTGFLPSVRAALEGTVSRSLVSDLDWTLRVRQFSDELQAAARGAA